MTEEQVNGGEEKKEEKKEEVEEKPAINLDNNPIVKIVKGQLSEDITETTCFQDKEDELTLRVKKEKIKEVSRDHAALIADREKLSADVATSETIIDEKELFALEKEERMQKSNQDLCGRPRMTQG